MCMVFSNAFDSVNHKILDNKFEMVGIWGTASDLIRPYLENRTQQHVEYQNFGRVIVSNKVCVTKSIPQGSILGPPLYILYTNELYDVTGECTVDIAIIFSAEDPVMLFKKLMTLWNGTFR